MMAQRGLPSGVRNNWSMSSAGPSIHAPNEGEASRPFRRIAKAVRSFGGKNSSSSKTPNFRMGGLATIPTSDGRSKLRPDDHSLRIRLLSKMCSRLLNGSASMSTRLSRPLTNPSTSSPMISSSTPSSGACIEPTMLRPTPAFEPGV